METVLLLASREYLNHRAVLNVIASLPVTSTIQLTQHRTGVGHVVAKATLAPNIELVKWQPTRPTQTCESSRAILFWDGTDRSILRSLAIIKRARVPLAIYDPLGNLLDLPTFCARLTHNGHNGGTVTTSPAALAPPAPPAASSPIPSVIVDAPPTAPGESVKRDSKIRLQLHLPETVYDIYAGQASAAKLAVEKVCSDRLRTCVYHTSGRGLYFTDAERSELERITGGHLIADSATALQRVKTTVSLKVGDIAIELTDRVLARCSSRAKSERRTLEDYLRKEVVQGLERSVGIRPW